MGFLQQSPIPSLMKQEKIALFPSNSTLSFSLIFFPSVGKIFFDFFCHFPFSLQVIHLLSPPSSGGCLPIACFTGRRFSSKSSSTFFLHHLNYEYVFYSINICHNVMFPKLPFLLIPVYHGKQDTQRIYVISSLLAGLLWAVTGTFIVSTLCC